MAKKFDTHYYERIANRAVRKTRFQRKVNSAAKWIVDNQENLVKIAPLAPVVVGLAAKGIRMANRHIVLKKEKDVKELYCYDRSLGHYWQLRRKLTNKDWVAIDKRKKSGERLADILSDLKVLK